MGSRCSVWGAWCRSEYLGACSHVPTPQSDFVQCKADNEAREKFLTALSQLSAVAVPRRFSKTELVQEFQGEHETGQGRSKPVCACGPGVGGVWVRIRGVTTVVSGKVRGMMGNAERMGVMERNDGTKYLSTDGFESVGDEKNKAEMDKYRLNLPYWATFLPSPPPASPASTPLLNATDVDRRGRKQLDRDSPRTRLPFSRPKW